MGRMGWKHLQPLVVRALGKMAMPSYVFGLRHLPAWKCRQAGFGLWAIILEAAAVGKWYLFEGQFGSHMVGCLIGESFGW